MNISKSYIDYVLQSTMELSDARMAKPNLFIVLHDKLNDKNQAVFNKIYHRLRKDYSVSSLELAPPIHNSPNFRGLPTSRLLRCLAIDSGRSETIRDAIKEILWSTDKTPKLIQGLNDVVIRCQNASVFPFKLSTYGVFVPYKRTKYSQVRTRSFHHKPVFYRYRVALGKLKQVPAYLADYLELLFTDCPNHLFKKSGFRASHVDAGTLKVNIRLTHKTSHDLINLAQQSQPFKKHKTRHENLQKFLLQRDSRTVACEVPVWIEPREFMDYVTFFKTHNVLTGHIDILRCETGGQTGVWDYKPKAADETLAKLQVFLYAFMLSVRSGIALSNLICGYFDEDDIYFFNPSEVNCFAS